MTGDLRRGLEGAKEEDFGDEGIARSEKSCEGQRDGELGFGAEGGLVLGEQGDSVEQDEESAVQEVDEKEEDVPPNGGYGWVCVACCFMINA